MTDTAGFVHGRLVPPAHRRHGFHHPLVSLLESFEPINTFGKARKKARLLHLSLPGLITRGDQRRERVTRLPPPHGLANLFVDVRHSVHGFSLGSGLRTGNPAPCGARRPKLRLLVYPLGQPFRRPPSLHRSCSQQDQRVGRGFGGTQKRQIHRNNCCRFRRFGAGR